MKRPVTAYQLRKSRGYRAAVSRKLGPKADTDEMDPKEHRRRVKLYTKHKTKGVPLFDESSRQTDTGD